MPSMGIKTNDGAAAGLHGRDISTQSAHPHAAPPHPCHPIPCRPQQRSHALFTGSRRIQMQLPHLNAADAGALGGAGGDEQFTRPVELEKPFPRMREGNPYRWAA